MNKLGAYKEILATIQRCASQVELPDIGLSELNALIKTEELQAEFGIPKLDYRGDTWFSCGEYSFIGCFGDKHNRSISWSDDGRQPEEGEWLYVISFPTGAYIFREEYCTDTFKDFFAELKAFNPKYSDTANHNLYFTNDAAANVHAAFPELLKKYAALIHKELATKRKTELEKELARLTKIESDAK